MSGRPPLELERPRDISELFGTSFRVYWANLGRLIAIAAAVSAPVNVIVLGIGLEELSSGYDASPSAGESVVLFLTPLLTTPLITAMTVVLLLDLRDGREPSARAAIQRGLDLFAPLLVAEILVVAGMTAGLLLLVLPGIYVAVRWYFVPQAVVVDDVRASRALGRSGELVEGSWWRVFRIVILITVIGGVTSLALTVPLGLAADAADRAALSLLGQILSETLIAPFGAVAATLLYFDLRARARAALAPTALSGPPDPPGLPPSS